ncbi:hypothetical protein GCM10027341_02480 [Spirosoma knui]
MNSLNILLVEDQSITAADIEETLEKAGHRITAIASNRHEVLAAVQAETPDLAIIDIHLEGSTADGIAIAQELLKLNGMPIIYLTANSKSPTFQRAKKTRPAAYLLKPFRQEELAFQVELAYLNQREERYVLTPDQSESLYVPLNKGYERIDKKDVLYLQASGAYVKIFMAAEAQPHLLTMHLGHLAQYFSGADFFRLSRSLLINLSYVSRLESNQLYLLGNQVCLPISEGSRPDLLKRLAVVRTPAKPREK